MLCTLLSSIDLDTLASNEAIEHHKSIKDLDTAARNGCELCRAISKLYREPYDWGQILFGVAESDEEAQERPKPKLPPDDEVAFWQPDGRNSFGALYQIFACCTTEGKLLKGR
jgi:hypothetical protein